MSWITFLWGAIAGACVTVTLPYVFVGITARRLRASQAALRESEARMTLASNAAHLGVWHWDLRSGEMWVTEKWRSLFGFAESEPVTFERLLQVVHPQDRAGMKQIARDMIAQGISDHESEYRVIRPDGSTRWIAGYGSVEPDAQGKPAFARGVSRDITRRKMAEDELRESEARFRSAADAAPVLIWMSGPDKLFTFFNRGWLDFTGRTLERELGYGWTDGVHGEDRTSCLAVYERAFEVRQSFTVEYRLRRRNGEYCWVLDTGTPRFDERGKFLGYVGSAIDISPLKQAEADHRLRERELARVDRLALMGELTASLAHEVNNPLGAMVTNASAGQRLIASGKVEMVELSELLGDIAADGHRARQVIEAVRKMVRKSEPTRSLIPINEIIDDLLRLVRSDSVGRGVTLTVEGNARSDRVMGDRVQLLQVLLNLTINAFEAMATVPAHARNVVIHTSRRQDGNVLVSVRDSGPGISQEDMDQLFDPFFSTKTEGTGMGLAIARSIVEAHGGRLLGENCDGKGACFTVLLPEAKGDA